MLSNADKQEAITEWLDALRDSADVYDFVAQESGWSRVEVLLFALLNRLDSIDDAAQGAGDGEEDEPWKM